MINAELENFPDTLRALVAAELAVGNVIVEVGHSFPAPPIGAYIKLAKPVTTRARASGDGLEFYERNSSLYSGEFTDARRFFFVLEPPKPPPLEPDMDLIRRGHQPPVEQMLAPVQAPPTRPMPVQADQASDGVAAIQEQIIVHLKRGATFSTAHKEGGTNILYRGNSFVRSDYGDFPDQQTFTDEVEFLHMLRQFYYWDVSRDSASKLSELEVWQSILRKMNKSK